MNQRFAISLLATAIATAPLAAQDAAPGSARDFQLPPASPAPSPTPAPQGPIDVEDGVFIAPRAITTPRPTPRPTERATPAATPTPDSTATASPNPAQLPTRAAPVAAPRSTATSAASPRSPSDALDIATQSTAVSTGDELSITAEPDTAPTIAPAPEPFASGDETFATDRLSIERIWPFIAGLIALLALIAGAIAIWRRKARAHAASEEAIDQNIPSTLAADISPASTPTPAPTPAPAPVPSPSQVVPPAAAIPAPHVPVRLQAEAVSLSRSVMNATLAYRLQVSNLGTKPLRDIHLSADMVTAHNGAPVNEQLAGKQTLLAPVSTLAEIGPGETVPVTAEIRLPVHAIRTIRQGNAHLFVPLLRLRVDAEGRDPVVRTFVVGMLPPAGQSKLQPFRLDELAQIYRSIGLRALD